MTVQKLPYDLFVESFKLTPRIAIDLWIKNENGAILYTKRNTEPYVGMWHLPGSFLLKGETISECVRRIAKEEIGLDLGEQDFKFIQLDEDLEEPRGHVVHLIYLAKTDKSAILESEDKKFLFEPPEPMIPSHRKIFLKIT